MKQRIQNQATPSTDDLPKVVADCWELSPSDLEPAVDPARLGFRTTDELTPLDQIVGQDRALRSLDFGFDIRHRGYNVFVSGMTGTGRKELIKRLLEPRAHKEPTPPDWVYLHNFEDENSPLALPLPAGNGNRLRTALEEVIDRLRHDLPAALKAKDFDAERERLGASYGQRSEKLVNEVLDHARKLQIGVRQTPKGMVIFPLKKDQPMEPAEIEKLSEAERTDMQRRHTELEKHIDEMIAQQRELSHQLQEEIEEIIRSFARRIVDPLIDRVKQEHPAERLAAWLDRVRNHLLEHLHQLQESPEENTDMPSAMRAASRGRDVWLPFRVNVVADNSHSQGAPVVVEISPTYKNLFGTIEHDVNLFGRITTDFTRIKPGSLLRANGGYLILDLEDALTEPLVWKALRRALKSGELLTEIYEPLAILTTLSLKPQPIPLNTKLIAMGSTEVYYLLYHFDEDFRELFKVRADFGPETPRDTGSQEAYARFIARQVRAEDLPPFDASAVAEIIRYGAREAAHHDKLSVEFGAVGDVVREASHWAAREGARVVGAAHVRRALEERVYRSDRLAEKVRELIAEGTLRLSLTGSQVGQVNGLAVLDLGDYRFGRPSRITASVSVGQEGLVNIERQSDLSGSTHNKGVLILEGYLRNRYAQQHPLALSASLAFEQSYGWIEGDSASVAELLCLLSAISDVPLRQDVAVTGSVNQHGEIQAVGGVNEKIEGFFDVCRVQGLTGTQGVCLPRTNVRNLVLRADVVEAVRKGQFHVWAIDTIDEGIKLLTGLPAGDLDRKNTFHYRLDQRLRAILAVLKEEPSSNLAAHVRVNGAASGPPKPVPPPLPGQGHAR